jgi:hypothetical protein
VIEEKHSGMQSTQLYDGFAIDESTGGIDSELGKIRNGLVFFQSNVAQ